MSSGSGQLTLPIDRAHEQTLENFIPGPNAEILATLTEQRAEFQGFWLCGATGSGKTHLLRALSLGEMLGHGQAGANRRLFVDASLSVATIQLEQGVRFGDVIAVDNAAEIAGNRAAEEALMGIYERLRADSGLLVLSHQLSATAVDYSLEDLNSRLRSLMHYQLAPLRDEEKAEILKARAAHRGYELSGPVLSYWLARGPRELQLLLTDLDRLDRASLQAQRHVTIPLLKEVLGY